MPPLGIVGGANVQLVVPPHEDWSETATADLISVELSFTIVTQQQHFCFGGQHRG